MSLLIAQQLKDKHVVLVGAGEVALTRVRKLLPTGCKLHVIASEIHPEIQELYSEPWEHGKIYKLHQRDFEPQDLDIVPRFGTPENVNELTMEQVNALFVKREEVAMVLTAIPSKEISLYIYQLAKLKGIDNVNLADKPEYCDFYFGANYNRGPLQMLVSSNGASPRMAALIRNDIAKHYDTVDIEASIANLANLRQRVREVDEACVPARDIKLRMEWIKKVTSQYSLKQWAHVDIESLIKVYPEMPLEQDFSKLSI